jgi:hypothetical protein
VKFTLLRGAAVVIAIVGAIDPPVSSMRRTPATIALVSTDTASSALADRVARELAPDFTVVRGPFAGAAAVVSVGDRLPAAVESLPASMPAFAVTSADDVPAIRFTAVRAPGRVTLESRVPLEAAVRVDRHRGRTLDVTLSHGGVVVDRVTRKLNADTETIAVPLTFVPAAEGPAALTVSAGTDAGGVRASADLLVDVNRARWAVLQFDRRPSWMSTFVRRALEHDPRFVVTSRVVTSRDLSSDTGRPPGSLDDLPALSLFDAVIVGAPESLTERDVAGLEAFLRRRGGAVCLLLDQRLAGPYERLLGRPAWSATSPATPAVIERAGAGDPLRLLATEMVWPTTLPAGGQPVAATPQPIIWSMPIGSGRVLVSGALDAWRYRDTAPAAFERFWQSAIADVASASPALVDVNVDQPLLSPGESTDVTIVLRDEALADLSAGRTLRASVHVTLDTPNGPATLRAWPEAAAGAFRAKVRAPDAPGAYRLSVTGNGTRVDTALVVQNTVARAAPAERDLLAAWTSSHGGIAVPAPRSREIGQALARRLPAPTARRTWHPMRSAWWILPFAVALGVEWWARRRAGSP